MRSVGLVVAGVVALSAGAAHAEDWVFVAGGHEAIVAVDRDTIRTNGNLKTYWSAWVKREATDGVGYILVRQEVDCDRDLVTQIAGRTYSEAGQMLLNSNTRLDTESITPGTVDADMAAKVCANDLRANARPMTLATFVVTSRELLRRGFGD